MPEFETATALVVRNFVSSSARAFERAILASALHSAPIISTGNPGPPLGERSRPRRVRHRIREEYGSDPSSPLIETSEGGRGGSKNLAGGFRVFLSCAARVESRRLSLDEIDLDKSMVGRLLLRVGWNHESEGLDSLE